jgi:hypoxanthine phosphoribosyltransferase
MIFHRTRSLYNRAYRQLAGCPPSRVPSVADLPAARFFVARAAPPATLKVFDSQRFPFRRLALHFPPDEENALFQDLERVLFTREDIGKRVRELGRQISQDYRGKSLVLISILKGGIVFLSDLMRCITIPHMFDLVGASSYRGAATTSGKVIITKDTDLDLRGKDVLIVEDILDTGHTLNVVCELLRIQAPASLEICCLLNKKRVRERELRQPLRYVGFEIGDEFVVGYGLDYAERYRNLSCVGVLKPEIYGGE